MIFFWTKYKLKKYFEFCLNNYQILDQCLIEFDRLASKLTNNREIIFEFRNNLVVEHNLKYPLILDKTVIVVFELKSGKYYIDKCSNVNFTFEKHCEDRLCFWTNKYHPISILETRPLTQNILDVYEEYCNFKGARNVYIEDKHRI